MSKIAFIFPGQGTQYIGMAKDFYENNQSSKEIFDKASNILGIDICKLCFEENDKLDITEFTQIAVLTASISILRAVEEKNIRPDITAGLSLGEYSALVANNTLSFEDAIKVVRKRGIYMSKEVAPGVGTMAAILSLDNSKIEKICNNIDGIVEPANYNCPGQIVVSGEKNAVLKANEEFIKAGAKRAIELNVSGPFHSSMLKGAGEKLRGALDECEINDFSIPYVSNTTAEIITDSKDIKELLVKQVYSSVKWQQSVEKMIEFGVDIFIEIGMGKTLNGFIKKIDRTKKVINIEKYEDLAKLDELI